MPRSFEDFSCVRRTRATRARGSAHAAHEPQHPRRHDREQHPDDDGDRADQPEVQSFRRRVVQFRELARDRRAERDRQEEQRHHLRVERVRRKLGRHRQPHRRDEQFGDREHEQDAHHREQRRAVGPAARPEQEQEERQPHHDRSGREFDRRRRLPVTPFGPDRSEHPGQDDDEDRVDRLHPRDRELPAEDVPVEPLVRVDRDDRELLLVQRPEGGAGDEERDERDHARAFVRAQLLAGEDHDEVGDGGDDGQPDDDQGQAVGGDHTEQDEQHDDHDRGHGDADDQRTPRRGQRMRDLVRRGGQAFASERVLGEPDGHSDRGEREPPVEAERGLQEAGEERAEEGAEVDAEVEDRETGVASRILLRVERADHARGVRFEPAAAERDEQEPHDHAGGAGQERERDVPGHDDDRAPEQHPLRAEHPVGQPRAEDRRQVDRPAVGADHPRGRRLRDPEPLVLHRVVEVDEQDALHPVEREPFPHLHAEDGREGSRLAEEGLLVAPGCGCLVFFVHDVAHATPWCHSGRAPATRSSRAQEKAP